MTRHCDRPGCGERATATLAYQYATSTVWLDTVADEADPSTYDLCRRHATGLTVPRGWTLEDRRAETAPTSLFAAERAS
jgi:Protein of unknown function (DUF3499)